MIPRTATAVALALSATATLADNKIVVEFAYPYSHLSDVTYQAILLKFYEAHPNMEIKMRATYESYEDGTNTILREAVAGRLPDVTMQGLNRQAIHVEKGIAKSLEPFTAVEADFAKDDYHKGMLDLGTFNDGVHGLPFSVALPVGYYNMEVMAKAGYDDSNLPTTWEDVVQACVKLREAGVDNPMFCGWNITGNWFVQALMWSQDKPTVQNADFQLDTDEGLTALNTMQIIFGGCEMQNLEWKSALASFSAGDLGMMYWSISAVGAVERAMGDFALVTSELPRIKGSGPLGLPVGGNAAMMVSTSEDPAELEAGWAWLKFITSGKGAADVARTTGDMPPNQATNGIILADFYAENPAKATAVRQLPLRREWQAYPGDKRLAATQVIYDGLEGIVTGEFDDMKELQEELTKEV